MVAWCVSVCQGVAVKVAPKMAPDAHEKRRHHEVSVYRPKGSAVFYYRVQVHGVRRKFSTGQTNRSAAIAQAKIIAARVRSDGGTREGMARPGWATVGECVRVWRTRQTTRELEQVVAAVRRFVLSISADWEAVSCERLSRAAFARFLAEYPGASAAGRMSTWATVRSMWQPRAMDWYADAGLRLPDMSGLRSVRVERGAGKVRRRFVRIPEGTLAAMDAAAEALRSGSWEQRRVWATYLLMRRCGLRNVEVAALRWSWIVEGRHSPVISLVARAADEVAGAWQPKGSEGSVPIRAEYVEALRGAFDDGEMGEMVLAGDWVIPRRNATDIARVVEREINAFVRGFIPDRQKGAYELRKQFGAEIAMRPAPDGGLEVAARLLRHASVATTWAHYHDLVHEPMPL